VCVQLVRGTVSLPHGTGRDARVAVITASREDAAAAEAAGAALVGGEDLVARIAEAKAVDADVVVATPDMLTKLGRVARILGPKCVLRLRPPPAPTLPATPSRTRLHACSTLQSSASCMLCAVRCMLRMHRARAHACRRVPGPDAQRNVLHRGDDTGHMHAGVCRGLMPNPKFGTVTSQVAEAVQELRRGKVQFRSDKGGTLSASIGRKTFTDMQLTDNFFALLQAVMDLRPRGLAGSDIHGFVERVSVSTTQGKGFPISFDDLSAASRSSHRPAW
jgi:ribosomal protein L1